jgi:hypothetical protein
MEAIPTDYNGIRFRSRLEARWACFFDLLQWKWDYEPFDLRGWIPDFILYGKEEDILVEVKPFGEFAEWEPTRSKIAKSMNTSTDILKDKVINDVVLSGYRLVNDNDSFGIGYLMERGSGCGSIAMFRGDKLNGFGFYSIKNSHHCRITGLLDGTTYTDCNYPELKNLWNRSQRLTQWRPPISQQDIEDKIRSRGMRFLRCKNGTSHHYKINNFRLYPPDWKVNGFINGQVIDTVVPDSLDTALDFIEKRGQL